jgi:hypothetical protein
LKRIRDIEKLIAKIDDNKLRLTEDGTDIINNHSHYINMHEKHTLLGYVAYERFRRRIMGGVYTRRQGRKNKTRRISYYKNKRVKR